MERHRRLQQAGAFVVLTCFPCASLAQDPLPIRLIPEYTACEIGGVRYACYTDQQMLELYTLETQAKGWYQESQRRFGLVEVQQAHIDTLKLELKQYYEMQTRAEAHVADLESKFFDVVQANTELEKEIQTPSRWQIWLGASLAVFGLGVFTAGVIKVR